MSSIIVRRPWTRQPQGAVRLNPRWVSRGLVYCAVGGTVYGRNGFAETANNGGITTSITALGRSTLYQSVGFRTVGSIANNGGAAFFAVIKPNISPRDVSILGYDDGSGGASRSLLYINSLDKLAMFSGGSESVSVATIKNDEFNIVAGVVDGTSYRVSYLNGVKSTPQTTARDTPSYTRVTAGVYYVGASPFANFYGDHNSVLEAVFDRALSDAEIRYLHDSPWSLISPRAIYVPTEAAAPSTPTITALTPTTIGATTHRPRFTYTA